MQAEYEITWKWVPLQLLGMGIGIWIMGTGVTFQPDRCPPGSPCNLSLAILVQVIGFVLFCIFGYSLLKMNFKRVWQFD